MRIILFSNNKHKAQEIRNILGLNVYIFSDFVESFDVIENENSFKGNAILKVKELQKRLTKDILKDSILLSEDSGICIEKLDNKPGIYSKRYANMNDLNAKNASDMDNIKKVLKELKDKNLESSNAYFVSCVAAIKDKQILSTHGFLYGRVIDKIRGNGGFGYDPIFVPNGYTKTLSELIDENHNIKDSISHRFNALNLMKILIK